MKKFSLSLVFPAYNEIENVESLVESAYRNAEKIADDFEIIVVNDGSGDGTRELLDKLKQKYAGRLKPIHVYPNRGYANALRTGFLASTKELVFYSDADNQFDLSEMPLLMERIEGNDMVIGFRKNRQDALLRLFVARCYNLMIRTLFGLKVRDIDCAFKLFRKEIFSKISIDLERFLIDTEILTKASRLGMKIGEVGVTHLPRERGNSTVRLSDVLFTLRGLVKLRKGLKELKKCFPS